MSCLPQFIDQRRTSERFQGANRRLGGLVILLITWGFAASGGADKAYAGCGDHVRESGRRLTELARDSAEPSQERSPTKSPGSPCQGMKCDERPASPVSPVRLAPPTRFDWAIFATADASPPLARAWHMTQVAIAYDEGPSAGIERPPRG